MKKVINIFIAVLLVLSVAGLFINISSDPIIFIFQKVIIILMSVFTLFYAFWGYKKPHGNLLRYSFLMFGIIMALNSILVGEITIIALIFAAVTIIVSYISGRLNKIEKNKYLVVVVFVLLVAQILLRKLHIDPTLISNSANTIATSIPPVAAETPPEKTTGLVTILQAISSFSTVLLWIALSLAYTSRYAAHKEAGLEDKPKA